MTDNYFNSKRFKRILNQYEESEKTGTPVFLDSDEFTDIAEYYQGKGETARACDVVDYALSIYPDATAPLVFKARMALFKQDNVRLAEQIAESISDKTDLEYIYIMAEIMIADNRVEEADEYLNEKYNDIDDAEREDFVLDVVTLFCDYELSEQADAWLQRAEETDTLDYKELMGRILMGKGRYTESERLFNELLDQDPYSNHYWNCLASSQLLNNHIQDAITSSEYSIAINPDDDEAVLNKANALFNLGNYEDALEYYKRFTALRPDEDTGEMYQGITLLSVNRLEEAVEHLTKAEQMSDGKSPNHAEICQELAFTLSRLHRMDEALAYIDKTDTNMCDANELMVLRGHVMLENGYYEQAQLCFSTAVKDSGASPHVYLRIAISVYDNGYIRLAYKMFNILFKAVDEHWNEGFSYMALCCKDLGKQDEYKKWLQKACTTNPAEARTVVGELFPPEMPPEEYYLNAELN
ncbi:MAG: tetratricopeptide repeat protein [Prevotella sp.]|nr:tetratricopeptide repeat protein [Prevotella sp.]